MIDNVHANFYFHRKYYDTYKKVTAIALYHTNYTVNVNHRMVNIWVTGHINDYVHAIKKSHFQVDDTNIYTLHRTLCKGDYSLGSTDIYFELEPLYPLSDMEDHVPDSD